MKTVSCDLCGKTADLTDAMGIEGWFMSSGTSEDLCPEHYEEVYQFVLKVRKNFIKAKKKKLAKNRALAPVSHIIN